MAEPARRLSVLRERRRTLKTYLDSCSGEEDWHGVADAAMDLREVDVEIRTLERHLDNEE